MIIILGLDESATRGSQKMVDYFIEKGANDFKRGYSASCSSNNKDLILFFMEKYPLFYQNQFGFASKKKIYIYIFFFF